MARQNIAARHHQRGDLGIIARSSLWWRQRQEPLRDSTRQNLELARRIPILKYLVALLESITPLGWTVGIIGTVATLTGLRFTWIEIVTIGVSALGALVIAVVWSLGRAGHRVHLNLARSRVTVGERALGQLTVSNPTNRRLGPAMVELMVGAGASAFIAPALSAGDQHEEVFGIATSRRGVVNVGPASTVRGDALGLVRRVQTWSESTQLYIHPATVQVASTTLGFIRDVEGATTQDLSSSDVSFHALRDYVPGDDRRNIHWRTTARTGRLMVRQFEETRRAHLLLVLDLDIDAWANETEFEQGVSAAASLARAAMSESKEVSIHTQVGPLKTPNIANAMDSLAIIDPVLGAERLPELSQKAGVEAHQASVALLITGSATPMDAMRTALARLPLNMVCAGIRIDQAKPLELRTLSGMPIVSIPTLDELGIALWKALG